MVAGADTASACVRRAGHIVSGKLLVMLRGLAVASVCVLGCNAPDIYALHGGGGSVGNYEPVGPGAGGAGGDASGGGGNASCSTNEIPLELTFLDGSVDSQVVPIV